MRLGNRRAHRSRCWLYRRGPKIGVSPASLDFGSVTVGQTKDVTVTVSNTGNAMLTISSIAASDPQFTMPTTLATVAAGGSGTFTCFKPATAGPRLAR